MKERGSKGQEMGKEVRIKDRNKNEGTGRRKGFWGIRRKTRSDLLCGCTFSLLQSIIVSIATLYPALHTHQLGHFVLCAAFHFFYHAKAKQRDVARQFGNRSTHIKSVLV